MQSFNVEVPSAGPGWYELSVPGSFARSTFVLFSALPASGRPEVLRVLKILRPVGHLARSQGEASRRDWQNQDGPGAYTSYHMRVALHLQESHALKE